MRFVFVLLSCLYLPLAAFAQGLDGSDRPGNWRVTFFEAKGIWTTICDEREEETGLKQRCYIRYVDVFSPRPAFAAMFLFVTPEPNGFRGEFGMEPGTLFPKDGFRLERAGAAVWHTERPGCLSGLRCVFEAEEARSLLDQMIDGGDLRFTFRDRHGAQQDLTWALDGFSEAFALLGQQSVARDLMSE